MSMQYENPYILEQKLLELKIEYLIALQEDADEEILFNLHEDIMDLKERIDIAWKADEEYGK